jgi:hypothetical protein
MRAVRLAAAAVIGLSAALRLAALGCSPSNASSDASEDAGAEDADGGSYSICDAFTAVGHECPLASPFRCFPECEVGGCYCESTADGPRWGCVTDLSCIPDCAPIEENCSASE